MKKEICVFDIMDFQEQYKRDKKNQMMEKKIKNLGIKKASANENEISNIRFAFNIEVPDVKIYHQFDSHQCNIYAFLRVVKDILRKNTDLDIDHLNLSANYINFYDKLEKINVLFNVLLCDDKLSYDKINDSVNRYIGSFGTFHFCREIVNKYGLVISQEMSEVNEQYDDALTIELLKDKLKADAYLLMQMDGKEDRKEKKKELMYEAFQFLSKVYGLPPICFEFRGESITPLQFKEKYLKNDLEDYVTVTSFNQETFLRSYAFIPNIYLHEREEIVHLSLKQFKDAVIRQLKDGISVWFSAEETKTLDYDDNILDDKIYALNDLLNIKNLSKNQKIALDMINYDHAMCITGALVQEGNVVQFKVDNSFGRHGKYKGQLIMTNSFFENCVITGVIHRKYLK